MFSLESMEMITNIVAANVDAADTVLVLVKEHKYDCGLVTNMID